MQEVSMREKGKYSITFIIAQVLGCIMLVSGIVVILVQLPSKVSLANLKPLFNLLAGLAIAVIGLILVCISYRIRWMHRISKRLDSLELQKKVEES